jgi:AGZA family xanthine/uracil permease-like MFS transporter
MNPPNHLTLTLRYVGLVKIIPVSLKIAAACGIGLFLALIGLSHTTGIGAVSGAVTTSLQVAGCPDEYFENGMCKSHKMTSHTVSASPLCHICDDDH